MIRAFSTHCTQQHQTHKIGQRRKCRVDRNNVLRHKDTCTYSHNQRYLKRNNLKISLDLLRFKENWKSRAEKMRTRTRVWCIPSIPTISHVCIMYTYFPVLFFFSSTALQICIYIYCMYRLFEATNNRQFNSSLIFTMRELGTVIKSCRSVQLLDSLKQCLLVFICFMSFHRKENFPSLTKYMLVLKSRDLIRTCILCSHAIP